MTNHLLRVPHPLDGFDAKLARADAHRDAVRRALERVTQSEPDLIPGDFDTHAHLYVFRARRDSLNGDAVSPILGDCVHNLRTALDYIVWELALETARQGRGASSIEFPIFTDATKFAAGAPKKIGSLQQECRMSSRTYNLSRGRTVRRPILNGGSLRPNPSLSCTTSTAGTKHRSLNLTEDLISASLVGFERLGIIVPPTPAMLPGRFKEGDILAAVNIPLGRPDVEVFLRVAYDIAFERGGPAGGRPVLPTLRSIRHEVGDRGLPALEPFFPSR